MVKKEDTVRFGHLTAWSKELGISRGAIARRLKKARIKGITGKTAQGRILQNGFYAEDDVRTVCAELIK